MGQKCAETMARWTGIRIDANVYNVRLGMFFSSWDWLIMSSMSIELNFYLIFIHMKELLKTMAITLVEFHAH